MNLSPGSVHRALKPLYNPDATIVGTINRNPHSTINSKVLPEGRW